MIEQKDSAVEKALKVFADLLALFLAANLAFDLRYYVNWGSFLEPGPAPWGELYRALPYMLLGWIAIFATFGLYRPVLRRREEFALLLKSSGVAFSLIFAAAFFYRGFSFSRAAAVFMVPMAFVLAVSFRLLFRAVKGQVLRWHTVEERLVLVGMTKETSRLTNRLLKPDNPYRLLGLLCSADKDVPNGTQRLGAPSDLPRILSDEQVDRVLLISSDMSHEDLMNAIDACLRSRTPWAVVPDLYDMLLDRLHMDEVLGVPVMGPRGSNIIGMNRVIKRTVDLLVACVLLVLLAPAMLMASVAVKLTSLGPVFFRQDRVGRLGRSFRLYKFRSMYSDAHCASHQAEQEVRQAMSEVIGGGQAGVDAKGNPVFKKTADSRVTPVGRFLRRFSLDELPQLFNVIRGDMSLVGPRPAVPWEVEQYRERHRRRLDAQPGITGLWQVSGRNSLSFDQMVELDIQYIENWSAGLDVRIFFKTIAAVIVSRGY